MTTETNTIPSLIQQGIDSGQSDIILIANQHPCFMKPSADGEHGLEQTILKDHEPLQNNEIASYLNNLGVELTGGTADFVLNREEPRVRVTASSDRMGRLSIVFRVIPFLPAEKLEAEIAEMVKAGRATVDTNSGVTFISGYRPTIQTMDQLKDSGQ